MSNDNYPINVGDPAPDFTLRSHNGREIKLSTLKGKVVVLYFYPKDFTSGCTREACDFRDNYSPLKAGGAVVLGVSPDSADSHTKFADKYSLPFILLTDPEHKVMNAYGAWGVKKRFGKETEGVKRSTVIIDSKGIVRKIWKTVRVDGHVEKVLAEVKKLQN